MENGVGERMSQERLSGVLLHVTSLPSYGGIGDFGPAAYAFVDFLAASKQRLWQVLPLSPTGYGSSPYSALSAFAGNPLLISLERLAEEGLLDEAPAPLRNTGRVDYAVSGALRGRALRAAFDRFQTGARFAKDRASLQEFYN